MPSVQRFLVKEGERVGQAIELVHFPFTFGRARACDVVLESSAISRLHARCTREGPNVYLEDLGSRNGTFLNGQRLPAHTPQRLRAGDTVNLAGVCRWVFDDLATTVQIATEQRAQGLTLDPLSGTVIVGGQPLDPLSGTVIVGGQPLDPPLSPNQFALLALLWANEGRVVSRAEIAAAVWGPRASVSDETLDALVSRLRKRLHAADPEHAYVITRRGFGLLFQNR